MDRGTTYDDEKQPWLFTPPEHQPLEPKIKRIHNPIWTENKAKLIERYLNLFVYITKHGTYIDAFAGPQEPERLEMWAAKLVLESEPMWLQHFHLFESDKSKVKQLHELEQAVPKVWKDGTKREIKIYPGDSNVGIRKL
jgi:three-Cys-motif partner protein